MSFILNALKKSELEQASNSSDTNQAPINGAISGHGKSSLFAATTTLLLLAVIMVAGVVGGFYFYGDEKTAPPPIATKTTAPTSKPELNSSSRFFARVVGILDGCLIEVRRNGIYQKISLANVTCMDSKSITGKEAKLYTAQQIFTKTVEIAIVGQEQNNLLIANVYTGNKQLLNRNLVAKGFAMNSGFYTEE